MDDNLVYTGSAPGGYKSEIRRANDGYSAFTWNTNTDERHEYHELTWDAAFKIAVNWVVRPETYA